MLAKIEKTELFNKTHNIENFSCGAFGIDNFLQKEALEENKKGKSITRVIKNIHDKIVGYYTINCSAVIDKSGGIIVYHPAIELKMFALHNDIRGEKYPQEGYEDFNYSYVMLWKVIEEITNITETTIGAEYIILYSVPYAFDLYNNNGFSPFTKYMEKNEDDFVGECIPMYLKLHED